jgi:hypothetical protein
VLPICEQRKAGQKGNPASLAPVYWSVVVLAEQPDSLTDDLSFMFLSGTAVAPTLPDQ